MIERKANTYRLYPTPEQSRFVCTGCAHEANADTNAAIVILKRGTDSSLKPAEGHRAKRPDDAGSIRRAA